MMIQVPKDLLILYTIATAAITTVSLLLATVPHYLHHPPATVGSTYLRTVLHLYPTIHDVWKKTEKLLF